MDDSIDVLQDDLIRGWQISDAGECNPDLRIGNGLAQCFENGLQSFASDVRGRLTNLFKDRLADPRCRVAHLCFGDKFGKVFCDRGRGSSRRHDNVIDRLPFAKEIECELFCRGKGNGDWFIGSRCSGAFRPNRWIRCDSQIDAQSMFLTVIADDIRENRTKSAVFLSPIPWI